MDTTVVLVPKSIPTYVFHFTRSLASGGILKICVSVMFFSICNKHFYLIIIHPFLPKRNNRHDLSQSLVVYNIFYM